MYRAKGLEWDYVVLHDVAEGGFFGEDHPRRPGMEIAAGTFPLAWTRSYGSGRVFVTLLGHDGRSVDNPNFQKVVLNGVDWVTRCLDI